jgi:hypothetical protein
MDAQMKRSAALEAAKQSRREERNALSAAMCLGFISAAFTLRYAT